MTIRNPRDLECWRLANQLREEVIAICEKESVAKDSRFCQGFMNASGSVCRNLAEGFTRFGSSYIVQFFGYALASLGEVQDYLEESRQRKFTTPEHFERLWDLSEHAKAAALNFQRRHRERLEAEGGSRGRRPKKPGRPTT